MGQDGGALVALPGKERQATAPVGPGCGALGGLAPTLRRLEAGAQM